MLCFLASTKAFACQHIISTASKLGCTDDANNFHRVLQRFHGSCANFDARLKGCSKVCASHGRRIVCTVWSKHGHRFHCSEWGRCSNIVLTHRNTPPATLRWSTVWHLLVGIDIFTTSIIMHNSNN